MRKSPVSRDIKIVALISIVGASVLIIAKQLAWISKHRQQLSDLGERIASDIDYCLGWPQLPRIWGLAVLVGVRSVLRRENLYDTSAPDTASANQPALPTEDFRRKFRTADGTYNDLNTPNMGSANTRFGRNVPREKTFPVDVLEPNPRQVSLKLMTRGEFQPATSLNLLAAAWIQFMVRDWFSHGSSDKADPWQIKIESGDAWHENPMRILRTRQDPTRTPEEVGTPPTYINTETHWWDGSQIYGSNKEFQKLVRAGHDGKLRIGRDNMVVIDNEALVQQPSLAGWWLGMSLMFTLFILEHNAICDELLKKYPKWSDDELFERARLINAALMAKIHTTQWTPAIISHPTSVAALHANWWGIAGKTIHKMFGRISSSEVISGIPGGATDHFDIPYSLTEEFTAVYRMHPLIPDELEFRSARDNHFIARLSFPEVAGLHAQEVMQRVSVLDIFYSFGSMNPGSIRLHNYPRSLQKFERPDGIVIDLAAHDILRCRELGVPRYNEFRRLLHLKAPATFEEMTDVPSWAEQLREVYEDDIEAVDLLVGMFAEPLPEGFGFSDTAFRIFVLMASRRLNSDRFFTTDFTLQIYSEVGMKWIENNDMSTVLLRHYPELAPALRGVNNPFAPWTPVS